MNSNLWRVSNTNLGQIQTSANRDPDSIFVDEVSCIRLSPKPSSGQVIINFKRTGITLEPSFDHLFATYSYTNCWRVGEYLTNRDRRSSYLPKFGPILNHFSHIRVVF